MRAEIFTFFPKVETGVSGVTPGVGGEVGLDWVSALKRFISDYKSCWMFSLSFLSVPKPVFDFVRL